MNSKKVRPGASTLSGQLINDSDEISMEQLCRVCHVEVEWVEGMIHEGILEPRVSDGSSYRFDFISVKRTRTVVRLQRDLGVNLPGAALAVELLERIDSLKRRG
jgi:chaperone modulatory protein CbpM